MMEMKLYSLGFKKLQEKENRVYFEKGTDTQQVFLIFDKQKNKIQSLDRYDISGDEMKLVNDKQMENEMKKLLLG